MSAPTPAERFDEIAALLRGHPDAFADAAELATEQDAATLDYALTRSAELATEQDAATLDYALTRSAELATEQDAAKRNRMRRWLGAGLAVGVVASGAVGVAALLRGGQPDRPEAGTVCRATAARDSSGIATGIVVDPVQGCREQWQLGHLVPLGGTDGVPNLVACIAPEGAVNVFPGDISVCTQLGLHPADPMLSPDNAKIVALQQRLVEEISVHPCQSVETVRGKAQRVLDESGLAGWTVQVTRNPGDECAFTGVDSSARQVLVISS